jgi:transcriptional regulator with XRE-family HTH domain
MPPRSDVLAALGHAVRVVRAEREISQGELAARMGLHRTYVGGIERGERNVSYENLVRLAEALELPLSELQRRAETDGAA